MSDRTVELILEIAQLGIAGLINGLMANQAVRDIVTRMVLDGRSSLTLEEEQALNDESNAIRQKRDEAIAKAKAEGR